MAYGVGTALSTHQLKLGLGSSDAPGPKLVENRGSGRPKSATTHKTVDAAYDMVMCAQRVTLVQIVDALGLSYSTVNTSLQIAFKVIKCVA